MDGIVDKCAECCDENVDPTIIRILLGTELFVRHFRVRLISRGIYMHIEHEDWKGCIQGVLERACGRQRVVVCDDTRLPIENSQSPMIPVVGREKHLCNMISTWPQI